MIESAGFLLNKFLDEIRREERADFPKAELYFVRTYFFGQGRRNHVDLFRQPGLDESIIKAIPGAIEGEEDLLRLQVVCHYLGLIRILHD
ncbi:hypothetical protein Y886_23450 [Xanthomonas hyacinthi DSM 19077]|nr:hypothetical protein Y886_23450 [Xanthomonas hyacinthi DSM 19077]